MSCCDNVKCLKPLANTGCRFFDTQRTCLMITCIFLNVLSWILSCVAMAASSETDQTVINSAWTTGTFDSDGFSYSVYYGFSKVVYDGDVSTSVNYADCSADYCNDCQRAGSTSLNCSVLIFLLTIVMSILSVLRMKTHWDTISHKFTTVIVDCVALLILIIAMGTWSSQCMDSLPSDNTTYAFGPGFGASISIFFFVLISFIINLFMPIIPQQRFEDIAGAYN